MPLDTRITSGTAAAVVDGAVAPAPRPGVTAWLLMLPLGAWLGLFVLAPMAIMVVYSFCQRDALGRVVFRARDPQTGRVTLLDNYARIFDPDYLPVVGRTALCVAVAAVVAYAAARVWRRVEDRARAALPRYAACGLAIAVLFFFNGAIDRAIGVTGSPWARSVFHGAIYAVWVVPFVAAAAPVRAARWMVFGAVVVAAALAFDREVTAVAGGGGNYLRILWQSVKYAGYTTALCVLMGYPVAYFIGTSPPRWRNLLLMGVMVPFWTSFLIRTYAWITILKTDGLFNATLLAAGVVAEPLSVLYTPAAVMVGLTYAYLPFMILPIYGSVEKLDAATVEAAFDLGAGPVRAFASVILPLTWPGIVAGCLLVFVPAIGMFAIQDLLGGARVPMIGNVIQNQAIKARDLPFGSALAVTLLAMFVLTYWLASRRAATTS